MLPNSLTTYLVSTDDGPAVVLGTGATQLIQTSSKRSQSGLVGGDRCGGKENLAHLGQSVANATIRLNSANSERSHVPSRWQGGVGWARPRSAQTPKQLANGTITWHMRGLRGRKNDTG